MLTDFTRGVGYALQGFSLARKPGVFRYALIPLLINAVLFGGAIWYGATAFSGFIEWLLPEWLDVALVRVLLWLVFAVGAALVSFYAFTLLANLVAAPFNGLLAASFGAEVRKLVYLAAWSLPLLLLFLIPGVNLAAPLLWLAFGAWMMALEYADCPLGNHGVVFQRSRGLIGRRRWTALGFGATVMVFTTIPGLNLVAMPVAVAGATALYVNELAPLVAENGARENHE